MIYEAIDRWNDHNTYLEHHGIKGMKWGVRRYQNADGSLTNRGRKKYIKEMKRDMEQPKGLTKGQKIAIGVGVGAAVAVAGTAAAVYVLKNKKNAQIPVSKLKEMGVSVATPERIKISKSGMATPVKNIIKGKSTVRNINLTERNRRDYKLANARKAQELAFNKWFNSSPRDMSTNKGSLREVNQNLLRKSGAAANNFVKVNSNYGIKGASTTYRPIYTTNSGRRITKRLR